ncbi:MAG: LEA type 2 family protein [Kiloniellales bacterium]|nr:LEA type 2 family protein [Kiloniellales bacterium]
MKRLAMLVLLVFGPAACATVPEEEVLPPRISLSDLRVLDSTGFEHQLELDLRVSNPNNFDIDLEGLSLTLEVNDSHFADGQSSAEVTLPRLGDAKVPVTATTTIVDVVRQVLLLGRAKAIDFRIEGFAYVTNGLGSRRVPFKSEGSLKLLPDAVDDRIYVPI